MPNNQKGAPATIFGIVLGATNFKHLIEWLVWLVLAIFVYTQTNLFDKPISEYSFGATGWPRTICLAIIMGATGQFLLQIFPRRNSNDVADATVAADDPQQTGLARILQKLGIFVVPLIYLFYMNGLGFFVTTPIFIIAMLVLLEVRSFKALFTVTLIVYGFSLLIFTRLFYVALPIGSYEFFYPINNAIVAFARIGL